MSTPRRTIEHHLSVSMVQRGRGENLLMAITLFYFVPSDIDFIPFAVDFSQISFVCEIARFAGTKFQLGGCLIYLAITKLQFNGCLIYSAPVKCLIWWVPDILGYCQIILVAKLAKYLASQKFRQQG